MPEKSDFQRILGTKDVLALAFGAAIGWGWVVLAGGWLLAAGTLGTVFAFLLGGVVITFVGLTYAELTSALPQCGGEHIFSLRALGWNSSFVCTWALILGYVGVVAFESCALPSVVEYILPGFSQFPLYEVAGETVFGSWVAVGVFGSVLITVINYVGVKPAARLQGLLALAVLLIGVALIGGAAVNGNTSNAEPLLRNGLPGVLSVTVMTPFMLLGFDVIPQAAEEIAVPARKVGRLILLSIAMAVAWYILVSVSVSLVVPDDKLAASSLVTADAMAWAYGGSRTAANILVIGGMAGILSSWNAFFVGGSRTIYAMARTGMLPAFLGTLHPKYKTPANASLLIGILTCLAPFFGKRMMTWLTNAGSFAVIVAYLLVALSFLRLRQKEPELPRPYRVRHWRLVGGAAVLFSGLLLILYLPGMPSGLDWPHEWGIILLWSALGLLLHKTNKRR